MPIAIDIAIVIDGQGSPGVDIGFEGPAGDPPSGNWVIDSNGDYVINNNGDFLYS